MSSTRYRLDETDNNDDNKNGVIVNLEYWFLGITFTSVYPLALAASPGWHEVHAQTYTYIHTRSRWKMGEGNDYVCDCHRRLAMQPIILPNDNDVQEGGDDSQD